MWILATRNSFANLHNTCYRNWPGTSSPALVKSSMFLSTSFINWPPSQQSDIRYSIKWSIRIMLSGKYQLQFVSISFIQVLHLMEIMRPYLEPRCKKPKQSRALEEILRYLDVLVPTPVRSKRTILSTNLITEKQTPAPCSRKSGEKRTGSGICLAPGGVP